MPEPPVPPDKVKIAPVVLPDKTVLPPLPAVVLYGDPDDAAPAAPIVKVNVSPSLTV